MIKPFDILWNLLFGTNWQQSNVAVDPRRICQDHSKVELDFPVMTGTGMTGVLSVPDFVLIPGTDEVWSSRQCLFVRLEQ